MNYLSINTSTTICSVSFFYKSKLQSLNEIDVKEHSKFLPVMCKKLINDNINELDFIALAIGPGSYSSLKIGCSFSKGLAYSIDKPIIPIPTFEGLNNQINNEKKYYISLYSHRDYAFFQLYKLGAPISKPICSKISDMKDYKIYGYGLRDKLENHQYTEIKPSAEDIGHIAFKKYSQFCKKDINEINPIYLSKEVKV
tara:strand:- start:194 stop:787 length:594 start_codon:yes stop_codon:yes gene_type:complete